MGPRSAISLVTRAICSRGVPLVGCVCPPVVVGLWLWHTGGWGWLLAWLGACPWLLGYIGGQDSQWSTLTGTSRLQGESKMVPTGISVRKVDRDGPARGSSLSPCGEPLMFSATLTDPLRLLINGSSLSEVYAFLSKWCF